MDSLICHSQHLSSLSVVCSIFSRWRVFRVRSSWQNTIQSSILIELSNISHMPLGLHIATHGNRQTHTHAMHAITKLQTIQILSRDISILNSQRSTRIVEAISETWFLHIVFVLVFIIHVWHRMHYFHCTFGHITLHRSIRWAMSEQTKKFFVCFSINKLHLNRFNRSFTHLFRPEKQKFQINAVKITMQYYAIGNGCLEQIFMEFVWMCLTLCRVSVRHFFLFLHFFLPKLLFRVS